MKLIHVIVFLLIGCFVCVSHAATSNSTPTTYNSLFVPALIKMIFKHAVNHEESLQHVSCDACKECCASFNLDSHELANLIKISFLAEHMDWTCDASVCPIQYNKRMKLIKNMKNDLNLFINAIEQVDDNTPIDDIRRFIKDQVDVIMDEMSILTVHQKMDALLATSKISFAKLPPTPPKPHPKPEPNPCRPWMGNCKPRPEPYPCHPWMGNCDPVNIHSFAKLPPTPPKPHPNPRPNPLWPCSPWMGSEMCEQLQKHYANCPYKSYSECDEYLKNH